MNVILVIVLILVVLAASLMTLLARNNMDHTHHTHIATHVSVIMGITLKITTVYKTKRTMNMSI